MLMTPLRLAAFRILTSTLGPFRTGSRLLRAILMKAVRRKGTMTYVAHADFLDVRLLMPDNRANPLHTPELRK